MTIAVPRAHRRIAGGVLVAVLAATSAACGATESGSPSAASATSSTAAAASTTAAPTSTSTLASPLAKLDPCALLPQADAAQLGFTGAGRRDDLAGLSRCVWAGPGLSVRVVLDPERGIADTNNGSATKVEDVQVGRHAGQRVEESSGPGYCEFDLAVSDASHATVAAIILSKTQEACGLAQRAVDIVEPKLP